jgi:ribosomal protein L37AE/L43A
MKRKRDGSVSTITCSLSSRNSTSKMARVNDAALDPTTGALKGRLDENYVHYPEPSTAKQPCCSLCHLVHPNRNVRTYTDVFQCDICKAHLCIKCFKPFHTIASVGNLKSQVLSFLQEK